MANHKMPNIAEAVAEFARLLAHARSIEARDFFVSPARKRAAAALAVLEQRLITLGGKIAPKSPATRQ